MVVLVWGRERERDNKGTMVVIGKSKRARGMPWHRQTDR